MELNTKMSKPLVISLLVLVAVLLLAIGAAIGSHSSRNHSFGYNNRTCGGFDNFERGGRREMMQGGRAVNLQGGKGMMYYQNGGQDGQIPAQGSAGLNTENRAIPATAPATATTTVK